jgi:hypothetical protein
MTDPVCEPLESLSGALDREEQPDRLAELLECLADLVVDVRARRLALAQLERSDDGRVRRAIERLSEMEMHLASVSIEVASVHQELQREHLI